MTLRSVVIAVLAAVLLYGAVEARPLISGPALSVESPADGETVASGTIEVAGRVLRATSFTIDGAPVLPTESGAFAATLAFPRGTSILTFMAADRFGRSVNVTRTIYIP